VPASIVIVPPCLPPVLDVPLGVLDELEFDGLDEPPHAATTSAATTASTAMTAVREYFVMLLLLGVVVPRPEI
jgi:hypothetical protein